MVHRGFRRVISGPVYAEVVHDLTYVDTFGDPFCEETRTHRFWWASEAARYIDTTSEVRWLHDRGTSPFLVALRLPSEMDIPNIGSMTNDSGTPVPPAPGAERAYPAMWVDGSARQANHRTRRRPGLRKCWWTNRVRARTVKVRARGRGTASPSLITLPTMGFPMRQVSTRARWVLAVRALARSHLRSTRLKAHLRARSPSVPARMSTAGTRLMDGWMSKRQVFAIPRGCGGVVGRGDARPPLLPALTYLIDVRRVAYPCRNFSRGASVVMGLPGRQRSLCAHLTCPIQTDFRHCRGIPPGEMPGSLCPMSDLCDLFPPPGCRCPNRGVEDCLGLQSIMD